MSNKIPRDRPTDCIEITEELVKAVAEELESFNRDFDCSREAAMNLLGRLNSVLRLSHSMQPKQ